MSTTASLGVAQVRAGETLLSAVTLADQALYLAKALGRDQVRAAAGVEVPQQESGLQHERPASRRRQGAGTESNR